MHTNDPKPPFGSGISGLELRRAARRGGMAAPRREFRRHVNAAAGEVPAGIQAPQAPIKKRTRDKEILSNSI